MLSDILSFFRNNDKLLLHTLLYTTTLTLSALVISRYFKSRNWSKLKSSPFYKPMEGKVCIITGGNSGIGFETAKELAKLKATVVIACRSMERGREALDKLKSEVKDGKVVSFIILNKGLLMVECNIICRNLLMTLKLGYFLNNFLKK